MGLGSHAGIRDSLGISDVDQGVSVNNLSPPTTELQIPSQLLGVRIWECAYPWICQGLSLSLGSSTTVQPVE